MAPEITLIFSISSKVFFFQLTIEAQKENKGFYAKVVKKGEHYELNLN